MVSVKQNGRAVRRALAAACAGAMMLAGCDNATSTSLAQKGSHDAAKLAQSAGDPRPTEALITEVGGVQPGDVGALKKLEARVTGDIKKFVVQNGADKDLDAAIKKLQETLKLELTPTTKSGVQAQLAGTQLQLAEYRFGLAQADILELSQQAGVIQGLAQAVYNLNQAADGLESGNKSRVQTDTAAAKTTLAERQKALADAQAKVKALQDQLAGKEAQAQKIYADTAAAFKAADALPGQAAIAAGNKAMQDRKQADDLMYDAGVLAPELAQAQAQVILAQMNLAEAQELSRLAQAANDQEQAATGLSGTRVAALRAAAQKIIGDEANKESLTGRLKAFTNLAGGLDVQLRNAVAAADQAASNYAGALSLYSTYVREALAKDTPGVDAADPLRKALKDDRPVLILAWSQVAAQQESGRMLQAGVQAIGVITKVGEQAQALKVGVDAKTPELKYYQEEAPKRFQSAATLAKQVNDKAAPPLSDVDRIKWIGYSLEATAQQGLYAMGNDKEVLKLAIDARDKAVSRKPSLAAQLSWIK